MKKMARPKEHQFNIRRFRETINRKNLDLVSYKKENDIARISDAELLDRTAAFNQQYLAKQFPALFKRKHHRYDVGGMETAIGYNYFQSISEYKKEMMKKGITSREAIDEYNKQLEDLREFIGVDKSALESGKIEDVEQVSRLLKESRDYEIGYEQWESDAPYMETRQWSSEDWYEVESFKNHLTSDEAISLEYAIKTNNKERIKYFILNDNNSGLKQKIGKVVNIEEIMDEETLPWGE